MNKTSGSTAANRPPESGGACEEVVVLALKILDQECPMARVQANHNRLRWLYQPINNGSPHTLCECFCFFLILA